MMRILIISNYVSRNHKEDLLIKRLNQLVKCKLTLISSQEINNIVNDDFDAVILTGSNAFAGLPELHEYYQDEIDYVLNYNGPILGICFGHQLLATAYNGKVRLMETRLRGFDEVFVSIKDPLFNDLPEKLFVCKAHGRIVTEIPQNIQIIAHSQFVENESMKITNKPIYGVQFHPERCSDKYPHGLKILDNFLTVAKSCF